MSQNLIIELSDSLQILKSLDLLHESPLSVAPLVQTDRI